MQTAKACPGTCFLHRTSLKRRGLCSFYHFLIALPLAWRSICNVIINDILALHSIYFHNNSLKTKLLRNKKKDKKHIFKFLKISEGGEEKHINFYHLAFLNKQWFNNKFSDNINTIQTLLHMSRTSSHVVARPIYMI